jgi:thiaminase/transcriptional activator TenA
MANGTVAASDFATYLAIEQRFVRTAARLLGYCIWQEPEWEATVKHATSLSGLVNEQTEYFTSRVVATDTYPVGADALDKMVNLAILDGGYPAVVTCLFAAETLYNHWCANAAADACPWPVAGPAGEWIDLHTSESFASQVAFLHNLVDRIDPDSFPDERLDDWFVRMLAAEDQFHDSASSEGAPRD